MPTEQEWQEQVRKLQVELEQLRKRLRENETLMHRATRKASDMMLLQEKYEALQKEVR